MGSNDRISFEDGYEGAATANKAIDGQGGVAQSIAKKQHGLANDLQGQTKGNFATQAMNGSTAAANNMGAGALLHSANAAGGMEFVRRSVTSEDAASDAQASEARTAETAGADLASKINRA